MKNFIIINSNGLAINTIVADSLEIASEIYPGNQYIEINTEEGLVDVPGIGWTYADGSWTKPINPFEIIE